MMNKGKWIKQTSADGFQDEGARFKTADWLGSGDAMNAKGERRPGVEVKLKGYVPGCGGDVWWGEHEDGTVAPYCFDELYRWDDGERRFECQGCGKAFLEGGFTPFDEIEDTLSVCIERIHPGERVPDGECRECGALVHEVGQPRVVIAVRGGVAYVEESPAWVDVVIEDYDNLEEVEAR